MCQVTISKIDILRNPLSEEGQNGGSKIDKTRERGAKKGMRGRKRKNRRGEKEEKETKKRKRTIKEKMGKGREERDGEE